MDRQETEAFHEDDWEYDAYRMGRATRTVEVAAPDGSTTIEEGSVHFDPINREDHWMWNEEEWIGHYVSPDGGIGFDGGVAVRFERVGIIEFPKPMTEQQAGEWLNENPEVWRSKLDRTIESDVTAADVIGDLQ
jgi:hypothetical protein